MTAVETTEIWIPLNNWPKHIGPAYDALPDLVGNSSISLGVRHPIKGRRATLSISLENPTDEIQAEINDRRSILWDFDGCLKVVFEIEMPSELELRKEVVPPSPEIPSEQIWNLIRNDFLSVELFCLQIALDISFPGAAPYPSGILCRAGKVEVHSGAYAHIWEIYKSTIGDEEVRHLPLLPIAKVWSWLKKKNGIRKGVSDSPISKAVVALTYVYDGEDAMGRYSALLWACAGLESLYGGGAAQRYHQLEVKIPALLKRDPAKVSEEIGHVYKVRSSYVHGNKGISSAIVGRDMIPDKHFDDEYRAKYTAIFLLLESIRACIVQNRDIINFKTYTVLEN